MESDLPLIEIAGEDDSLLEQLLDPDDTFSNNSINRNYFACSPLQHSMIKTRPTRSKGLKVSMDPSKPSCSSPQSSSNKENINMNKSEVPKLSVEPLQMKKRKKGGGYNLRKSLAWDRAFDTDEGVLDPHELSIITGAFGKSYRDVLPIIIKEGKNSLYAGSNWPNESEDLQSIKETLYTELPDRSNTLKEDKEKTACSVPKHDSLAHDNICLTPKATQKVLSMYGGAKSGLKRGGCPRPLASSSLKRPASANTVRVIRNDSKFPKLPASKPGSCLLPTNTKNTTLNASHLKPNQIAKPAANIQKNVGVKSSSKNVKSAQTKAKTSPGVAPSQAKDPAQNSVRNLTNSLLEVQSSTNSRPLQVSRANCGSEVIPQPAVASTRLQICEGKMPSAAPAISRPPIPCVVGGKTINPKNLSVKPSGLRMPSPSIGFFGQPKTLGSDILLQKTVGPCNSNPGSSTHGTRKTGVSRPPPVPVKTPLMANGITECVNSGGASSSSKQYSAPSALCAVSDQENGGANEIDDVSDNPPVGHAQQLAPSTSTDHTGCLEVCHSSDKSAKSLVTKIVCLASESTFQLSDEWKSDDSMMLVTTSCSKEPHCKEVIDTVQCIVPERNDVSVRGSSVSTVINMEVPGLSKDGEADVDLVSEQPPMEEENVCSLLTKNHEHTSRADLMLDVSSIDEAMPLDFGTPLSTESGLLVQTTQPSLKGSIVPCKVVDGLNHNVVVSQMPENDSISSQRMEVSGSSLFSKSVAVEDSQYYLGDAVNGKGCNDIRETSHSQIQTAGQTHKGFGGVGNILESHLGDAHVQLFDGDILVGPCSRHKSVSRDQSPKIVGPLEVFEEKPEMPDVSLKVEQVFEDLQLLWKDNLLCDSEEFRMENVAYVSEEVYECDLETSTVITQAPPAELENCRDFAEDLPSVEDAPSGSPGVDSADYEGFSIDRRIRHSMEHRGLANSSGESNLQVSKDESTNVSTTCTELCPVSVVSLLTGSVDKIIEKQAEVHDSNLKVEEVFADNNQVILKDYLFSEKNTDSKDIQQDNISESLVDVPEISFIYEREPKRSDIVFQVPLQSGLEFTEDSQPYVADAPSVSFESLAENHESFTDGQFGHDMEISGQAASEIDSDLKVGKDQVTGVNTTCKEFCSVHEESCSLVGKDTNLSKSSSQLRIGVDGLKRRYQDETETKDVNCFAGEFHHELDTAMDFEKDKAATLSIKSSENNLKLDIPLIKPPPNAIPFSDEWLAAIEAAGEDILTLKCGAVQNSPTDKSLPEPGPWSPVKRKNNQLGPFDCTKFGNSLPADHQ